MVPGADPTVYEEVPDLDKLTVRKNAVRVLRCMVFGLFLVLVSVGQTLPSDTSFTSLDAVRLRSPFFVYRILYCTIFVHRILYLVQPYTNDVKRSPQ